MLKKIQESKTGENIPENEEYLFPTPEDFTYESLKKYDETIAPTDAEVERLGGVYSITDTPKPMRQAINNRRDLTYNDKAIKRIGVKGKRVAIPSELFDKTSSIASRMVYQRYVQNMLWYFRIVPKYFFLRVSDEKGIRITIPRYKENGHYNISMYHIATMAVTTRLPMGTWMFADISILYTRGVISFYDEVSFKIAGAYFTDGVFFYSKQYDKMYPIGSPVLQKYIDKNHDSRAYILDNAYFIHVPIDKPFKTSG